MATKTCCLVLSTFGSVSWTFQRVCLLAAVVFLSSLVTCKDDNDLFSPISDHFFFGLSVNFQVNVVCFCLWSLCLWRLCLCFTCFKVSRSAWWSIVWQKVFTLMSTFLASTEGSFISFPLPSLSPFLTFWHISNDFYLSLRFTFQIPLVLLLPPHVTHLWVISDSVTKSLLLLAVHFFVHWCWFSWFDRRLAFHLPILVLGGALVGCAFSCAFSCSGLNLYDLGFVLSSNLGFVLCVWLIVLLERDGIWLSVPAVGTGTQGTCVVLYWCACACVRVCMKCALSQPSKISILWHGKIGETDRMNSPTNEL